MATTLLSTTTTLTASASTGLVIAPVTLTATATATSTPSGTMTFLDGATVLGTATLDASGSASLTVSTLGAGLHTLTASLAAGATFAGSTSSPTTYAVLALGRARITGACMATRTSPLTLRLSSSISSTVTVAVKRRISAQVPACGRPSRTTGALTVPTGRYVAVGARSFRASATQQSTTLAKLIRASKLSPGAYQLELVARSADGVATRPVRLGFIIKAPARR